MLPHGITINSSTELSNISINQLNYDEAQTKNTTAPQVLSFCQQLAERQTTNALKICCYASAAAGLLLCAGVITYTLLLHKDQDT